MAAQNRALSQFMARSVSVLVVTDVAARGLDLPVLDIIIHFDFPANAKVFVHRTGRTARAGRKGECYGLMVKEEIPHWIDLCFFLGVKPTFATIKEVLFGSKPQIQHKEPAKMKKVNEKEDDEKKEGDDENEKMKLNEPEFVLGIFPSHHLSLCCSSVTNISSSSSV